MAESVTLVALPQMVDLSLNCHDGVINFHALHTTLHVMMQQLNLSDVAVEFRGSDSERIQSLISALKPSSVQTLPKYSIVSDGGDKPKQPKKKSISKKKTSLQDVLIEKERHKLEEKKEKELRVIERRKDSKEDPDLNPLPLKSPPGSLLGITPADLQTVVVVESQSNLPQYSVAVTKATFDSLQEDIDALKEQIKELTELPANLGLVEATRTHSGPILDMFQILNVTKRMDATETALEKIGSLIEDLIRSDSGVSEKLVAKMNEVRQSVMDPASRSSNASKKKSSIDHVEIRLTSLENAVRELQQGIGNLPEGVRESFAPIQEVQEEQQVPTDEQQEEVASQKPASEVASIRTAERGSVVERASTAERASLAAPDDGTASRSRKSTLRSQTESIKLWVPSAPYVSVVQGVDLSEVPPNQALALIQEEFNNLKKWMTESIQEVDKQKVFGPAPEVSSQVVENKFKECVNKISELNELYNQQIGLLNEQFNSVQNEMNDVAQKLDVILPGGDSTGISAETTMDLANKLVLLEKEIITLSDKAAEIQAEKEERDRQTEVIMEQIDILKIVKANREDLEDALGDKADACQINRKVSHDQFDAACDDLARGIEEALTKLEEQEEMWHQALDAIQKEVGNKLDKMEVDPLRDFVNSKLRALQEKFKSLTQLKREQEAAGTKSRFLRNVNCISCDKDVVMRKEMDSSLKPQAYAMPPSRNMAPYLAYELDQLRKQQKCIPNSKNLNFIESALRTRGARDKNHVCNRYCGGSHTVTTPQQRVTRLGHFLEQWGPEIAPLQDEYIRGNDNHMYKARDDSTYSAKKASKAEAKGSIRPSAAENIAQKEEEPQQDRATFINPEAQDMLTKEAVEGAPRATLHIGVIEGSLRGSQGSQQVRASTAEARGSQAPRASQAPGGDQRPSQAPGEARMSQQPRASQQPGEQRPSQFLGEARMSQQPRTSQVPGEPRTSQVPGEPRMSQAQQRPSQMPGEVRMSQGQPRTSQVPGEPRMSQGQPRSSQVPGEQRMSQQQQQRISQTSQPRASQVAGEQRASQAAEPRASQAPPRASQVPGEPRMSQQPRASQAAGEPRASQAAGPRGSQAPPRASQVPGEPRMSQQPRTSQAAGEQRVSQAGERGSQGQVRSSQVEAPSGEPRASQARASQGQRQSEPRPSQTASAGRKPSQGPPVEETPQE